MIFGPLLAFATPPVAPIREVDHPTYVDASGAAVTWAEVHELASHTDALQQIRRRRLGRTVLRFGFAAATAVEAWGAARLFSEDHWLGYPLAGQAGFTGLCGVLAWTSLPQDRQEDRAILVDAANGWSRTVGR